METNDEFSRKIEQAQKQAESLQRQAEMSEEFNEMIAPEAIQAMRDTLEELHVAEEELRQSNEELAAARNALEAEKIRYQHLFDFAPDGYLVTNPMGVIQEANQTACIMLGYQFNAISGKPLAVFVSQDDKFAFSKILQTLQEQDQLRDHVINLAPREAGPFPVSVSVAAIRDPNGDLSGLRWLVRDISEQVQAEQKLRASEERFRTMVEAAPSMLIITDENGENIYASPNCAEFTGYTQKELLDELQWWVHDDDSSEAQEMFTKTFSEGIAYRDFKYNATKKNGDVWNASSSWEPYYDEQGKFKGVVLQTIDITERVQAEQELRQSEKINDVLLNAPEDLVALVDLEGTILQVNHAVAKRFNKPQDELIGLDGWSLVPPEIAKTRKAYFNQAIHSGQPVHFKDQSRDTFFENTFYPIADEQGEIVNVALFARDITERVQADEVIHYQANLLDCVSEAIISTDIELKIVSWNEAARVIYGWTESEVLGKEIDEILGTQFLHTTQEEAQAILVEKGVWAGEVLQKKKSGEEAYIWVSVTWVKDKDGNIIGGVTANRDITEKKRIETALWESEEKFRVLSEDSPMAIAISKEGRYIFVNKVCVEMFGFDFQEEMLGTSLFERLAPESIERVRQYNIDREKGMPVPEHYEIMALKKDGTPFPMEISVTSINLQDNVVTAAFAQDITVRKKAEEELKQHRDHLDELVSLRTAQLDALRQVSLNISQQLDPQSLLELIVSSAIELTPAESGGCYLYNSQADVLEYVYGHGMESIPIGTQLQCGEGLSGAIWESNQAMIVPDYPNWQGNLPPFAQLNSRSVMGAPLRWGEESLGVLNVAAHEPNLFTNQDLEILTLLAAQASISFQNARYFEQIQTSRERYQDLSKRLATVQERERRIIAHELHDEIGQDLTALMLRLDAHLEMSRETAADIQVAKDITTLLFEKVHNLSLALRPSLLDDLGLLPTLNWLFQNVLESMDLHVNFEHRQLDQRFPAEIELAAFRIIQEAINNIARHTDAAQADVQVWVGDEVMQIQIADQGDGFDPQTILEIGAAGGLLGMSERANWVGGQFEIDSASGQGTTILANLPLAGSLERRSDER